MLIASALSNVQIAFVVGHELSHSLHGHLEKPYITEARFSKLQAMEHAADIRGGELALASFLGGNNAVFPSGDNTLAQAGIDIFFTYLIFVRDVLNQSEDPKLSPYPSPEARRAKLRERFWDEMPEQARALATQAEEIFAAFAEILEPDEEIDKP